MPLSLSLSRSTHRNFGEVAGSRPLGHGIPATFMTARVAAVLAMVWLISRQWHNELVFWGSVRDDSDRDATSLPGLAPLKLSCTSLFFGTVLPHSFAPSMCASACPVLFQYCFTGYIVSVYTSQDIVSV